MLRLADLREILRYVPQYRDRVFVIAVDGAVVDDANFRNLLLDIALFRSLRIGVVLIHGAGHQVHRLAEAAGITPSNLDGTGVTDQPTMQLALTASHRVTQDILEGLAANDLRGALGNAIVAHPAGILQGVDHLLTGRVERIDIAFLRALMEHDIIPVISPLGTDGEGNTYRLNSDAVAVEVARSLQAVKLIYLTTAAGILLRKPDEPAPGRLLRQLTAPEAETVLRKQKDELTVPAFSKLASAARALRGGVPRVHIIDGGVEEGLLAEVFSNEGIGTLVHANEYQAIRRAHKKDVRGISALIKTSVENEELLPRSLADIERQIGHFYVFDVDGNLAGCVSLQPYPDQGRAEMACLCVSAKYENQGIGARLMQFLEEQARNAGLREMFCLSTQAINYFVQKGGFQLATPADLPADRRQVYEASGRHSQVLLKKL